jgi:RNA polymerase sigma-70 factor (ECF subfamily)
MDVVVVAPEAPPACPRPFAQVFVTHRRQLVRAALDIVGNAEAAEDLVQEACLGALENEPPPDIRQPLAYALRCVRNLALDSYRRTVVESRIFDVEDEGMDVPAPSATPEVVLSARQQALRLMSALAELPARARQAVQLYRLDGVTQREIADMFSVSPTLVNFMIRDALAHCRAAVIE